MSKPQSIVSIIQSIDFPMT